jgi:hypothetical protein
MHALLLVGCLLTSAPDAGNAARPLEFQKKVSDTDLEGRSLYELALMRNYPFARAHNVFRKSWLRKYFADQGFSAEGLDEGQLDATGAANAEKVAAYEASLTREQLLALRDRARKQPAGKEKDLELRLLSERLGEWAGEGEKPKDLSPLEDPAKLDQLLTVEQLDDFSPRDLKLLRNTIFARRGRAFVTPMLKAHFATVAWYKADPDYADSRLTRVDKKNVALVLSLEKKLGGTTVPDETKERWYGRA